MTNNSWIGYVILILVGTIASLGGLYVAKKIEGIVPPPIVSTTTPPVIIIKSSEYPDYDSLSKLHKLTLAENFESWTPKQNINYKMINRIVIREGQLSKAYIYAKVSLNNSPLTQWESLYFKASNTGGHLFRPLSLPVPSSTSTELLYALNQVPITGIPYSDQNKSKITNIFQLFKTKKQLQVISFISSLRPAKIEELSLYYECVEDDLCNLTTSTKH